MADANKEVKPSFVKRHHRSLSFFSLLIAVAVYVVNEDIRESMKDLIDEIESAQSTFQIRGDIIKLQERIDRLVSPAPAIATINPTPQRSQAEEVGIILTRVDSDISKVREELSEVGELQEKIGMDTHSDNMDSIRTDLDKLNAKRIKIGEDIHSNEVVLSPFLRANALFMSDLEIQENASKTTASTLKTAQIYKVGHEYLYTWARRIGLLFFVLGLVLNFFVEGRTKAE